MDKLIKETIETLSIIDPEIVLEDDLKSQYPSEFEDLSIHQWIVPKSFGGDLESIEGLFMRGQILASHNITAAIALGQCFLGSLPVWIGADEPIKKLAAQKLLNNENCCLALTEREHGSDLSASKVVFEKGILNGEKWCINNATLGTSLSVLVNTEKGLSLLFLDKSQLDASRFSNIPKIRTHGIRGADISGIKFDQCKVDERFLIGRKGKGLDTVARTLQVSRTLCSAFSVGAVKACLKMTEEFADSRELYGKKLIEISAPAMLLAKSRKRLELIEGVSRVMSRMVTMHPEVMSLYSAVTKYLIPKIASETIEMLSEVLGARSYINDEEFPLFEKFKRDHAVVPLFDGSSAVNLFIISGQMRNVERHLGLSQEYSDVFDFKKSAPSFEGEGLKLSNRGSDIILSHYRAKNLSHSKLDEEIKKLKFDLDPFSFEARGNSDRYARIILGACGVILGVDIEELFEPLGL